MNTKYTGPIKEVKLVEKVKLTKEQSEVLEKMRDCHHLRNDKQELLLKHFRGWSQGYVLLNEIPMLHFAQLLLNDFAYDVEPEQPKFQVGDTIIDLSVEGCPLIRVHTVGATELFGIWGNDNQTCVRKVNARLATREEIFWLETLKRQKVKDFRIGDIFIQEDGQGFGIDTIGLQNRAYSMYAAGNFQGLHPAESFRPFKKEKSNAHHREN